MALGHSLGSESTPVVVSVWGDYQCPDSRTFVLGPERQLVETFVKNGQAWLVWYDFPFLGQESYWAAEAAEAAGDQGRYWDYHNLLYREQGGMNSGAFAPENLLRFAEAIGLDLDDFARDIQSGRPAERVAAQKRRGEEIGISSTPTVFVNDQQLPGIPTFDELSAAIQAALGGQAAA